MEKTCWRPFAYLVPDHLAAQDHLNAMAKKGWELDRIAWGYFAKFKRSQREDLTYFLDWTDPEKGEQEDYLQLCRDAGWDLESVKYQYQPISGHGNRASVTITAYNNRPFPDSARIALAMAALLSDGMFTTTEKNKAKICFTVNNIFDWD